MLNIPKVSHSVTLLRLSLNSFTQLKISSIMKKVLFLFAFIGAFSLTGAMAQSCQGAAKSAGVKSCCASKAAKAAMSDASIEKRADQDGTVSYVRKESDAQGNVRFVAVSYDEAANTFVNVAPVATTEKKACCAGKSDSKACCSSKSKASCEKKESKTEN